MSLIQRSLHRIATSLRRPLASSNTPICTLLYMQCNMSTGTEAASSAKTPQLLLKLRAGLKDAMRARDQAKLDALRTLLSTINNNLKSPTPPRTDPHILTIIQKQLSQSASSIADFRSAGREDLVAKEQSQVDILSQYASCVEAVSPELVEKAIEDAVTMLKDKGEKIAMGAVMREVSRVLEQTEKAWNRAEVAVMVKQTVQGQK